jgi:flagellar hook-length control protein FliK
MGSPPFSALLLQTGASPSESIRTGNPQTKGQGNSLQVGGTSKRDAKISDTKSADAHSSEPKSRGNTPIQTVLPTEAPDKTVPVVVIQPQLSPALLWSVGMEGFLGAIADADPGCPVSSETKAAAAPSGSNSSSTTELGGESPVLATVSKDFLPARSLADVIGQGSLSSAHAQSESSDTINKAAIAGITKNLSGTTNADSTKRIAARIPAEATDSSNKPHTPAKSEGEQTVFATDGIAPAPRFTPQGKMETTTSPTAPAKVDKLKASSTQEGSRTVARNSDVTAGAKNQSHKDDAPTSSGSQGNDTATFRAPRRTIEPSTAFTLAGIQPSNTGTDGKSATPSLPQESSTQQASQLDQKSTGVARSEGKGEGAPVYPTSLVHSAKLVQRIGEAELRLGIRAGEFGSVDIRTSMIRNQFTAEISTERGELSRALAAELPSLQNRLSEQRVPVANITVQSHAGNTSTASEQHKPRDGQQQMYIENAVGRREEGSAPVPASLDAAVSELHLDIHM